MTDVQDSWLVVSSISLFFYVIKRETYIFAQNGLSVVVLILLLFILVGYRPTVLLPGYGTTLQQKNQDFVSLFYLHRYKWLSMWSHRAFTATRCPQVFVVAVVAITSTITSTTAFGASFFRVAPITTSCFW